MAIFLYFLGNIETKELETQALTNYIQTILYPNIT